MEQIHESERPWVTVHEGTPTLVERFYDQEKTRLYQRLLFDGDLVETDPIEQTWYFDGEPQLSLGQLLDTKEMFDGGPVLLTTIFIHQNPRIIFFRSALELIQTIVPIYHAQHYVLDNIMRHHVTEWTDTLRPLLSIDNPNTLAEKLEELRDEDRLGIDDFSCPIRIGPIRMFEPFTGLSYGPYRFTRTGLGVCIFHDDLPVEGEPPSPPLTQFGGRIKYPKSMLKYAPDFWNELVAWEYEQNKDSDEDEPEDDDVEEEDDDEEWGESGDELDDEDPVQLKKKESDDDELDEGFLAEMAELRASLVESFDTAVRAVRENRDSDDDSDDSDESDVEVELPIEELVDGLDGKTSSAA